MSTIRTDHTNETRDSETPTAAVIDTVIPGTLASTCHLTANNGTSRNPRMKNPTSQKTDLGSSRSLTPSWVPVVSSAMDIASACPQKPEPVGLVLEHPRAAVYGGKIADNPVKKMLVDTGASRTIVNSQWVLPAARTGVTLPFSPFSGEPCDLHLARVPIAVTDKEIDLEVAVQDDLKYDALLGLDIPFLWNLGDHLRCKEEALAVQTRAQAKKQDHIEQEVKSLDAESGVIPSPLAEYSSDIDSESEQQ